MYVCVYVVSVSSDEKRFQGSTVGLVNVFSNISDLLDYPSSRLLLIQKILNKIKTSKLTYLNEIDKKKIDKY